MASLAAAAPTLRFFRATDVEEIACIDSSERGGSLPGSRDVRLTEKSDISQPPLGSIARNIFAFSVYIARHPGICGAMGIRLKPEEEYYCPTL